MSLTIGENGVITSPPLKKLMLAEKNSRNFSTAPDTIIIHYTAGSDAFSSASWLQRPDVQASAHVVIGKEGEIYQIVPFTKIAWHAGQSSFGGRTGFNSFSIGIEIDNPGFLTQVGNEFISAFGTRYPANEVIQAVHRNEKTPRFWHVYTAAQIAACEELCLALKTQYPTINQILGHEEISPGRKQDPGPAFPLDKFRMKLLENNRMSDVDEVVPVFTDGRVNTDKLNIRSGAGTEFDKIAKPLSVNKRVKILGERNGWYHVRVDVEGWVSKAFISNDNQP